MFSYWALDKRPYLHRKYYQNFIDLDNVKLAL